jgi:hypothetical protein
MIYLKRFQYLLELLLCVVIIPFVVLFGGVIIISRGEADGLNSLLHNFLANNYRDF